MDLKNDGNAEDNANASNPREGDAVSLEMMPGAGSPVSRSSDNLSVSDKKKTSRHNDLMAAIHLGNPTLEFDAGRLQRIVNDFRFKLFMNVIIVLSCIEIGFGVDAPTHGYCVDSPGFIVLQCVLLFFFIVEYILQVMANGKKYVFSFWGLADFFLTVSGIFTILIFGMIHMDESDGCSVDSPKNAGTAKSVGHALMSMRVIRIIQIARLVRLVASFRLLWSLVRGMESALKALSWALLLMLMWFYFFGVLGVQLVGKNSWLQKSDVKTLVDEKYGNVLSGMLTSLQIATLDSWNSQIASSMLHEISLDPDWGTWMCFVTALYFLTVFGVGALMMMNLITALIVNQSIEGTKQDHQAQAAWEQERIKRVAESLERSFIDADKDGDGTLKWEELESSFLNSRSEISHNLKQLGDLKTIHEMFDLMDTDGSGSLDAHEFTDGVQRFQSDFQKFMLIQLYKSQTCIRHHLDELEKKISNVESLHGSPTITPRRKGSKGPTRAAARQSGPDGSPGNQDNVGAAEGEDVPDIIQL